MSYNMEKKRKKKERFNRKKGKIGLLLKDLLTRKGNENLSFLEINQLKQFLGVKRLLYLLRFFMKLAGRKQTQEGNKKKLFNPFEKEPDFNHIVAGKKILDVIFLEDQMTDYLDYSSASENDSTYEEFENEETTSSEGTYTEESKSATSSPTKSATSPEK